MVACMNQREYDRMKAAITAEYKRKLEALELVWQMAGGSSMNTCASVTVRPRKGELQAAVREAVETLPQGFSVRNVEEAIRVLKPRLEGIKRASLSSALKRLVTAGEIQVVTEGSGKRASTYRKAGDLRIKAAS
jgi:hypothetical protein